MTVSKIYSCSFLFLLLIACTGCLSDIRTTYAKKEGIAEASLKKGKVLMDNIHAGQHPDTWKDIEVYEVTLNEQFYGLMGSVANPFPEKKIQAQCVYAPGTYDGKMTFQQGKLENMTWGIQSWKTYTQSAGEEAVFEKHKKGAFWIPTYQYFMELPARIQNGSILTYAGEASHDGKTYDLVYATWKEQGPQKDIDQYMIWINKENKLVEIVEYTVRDFFSNVTGVAFYEGLHEVKGGLMMPNAISIKGNKDKKALLHQMQLSDFKVNHIPISAVRPDASLEVVGDDKE